ncbi:hypothetical protein Bca52824_025002 [Brassica carinata]|uniref:Hydroxyproline-rich glycoprotein family protein n=1 Tax=Brassica carinata TaxID=52824 RepID=A0A8X7VL97_BRACI|nr:hypothetical protein Bca52824_025002 [Brassica carinata]
MGSEQLRFPQHDQQQRKRWGGCLGVFSCFKSQKGLKQIVPSSRIPECNNASASQPNGPQRGGMNLAFMAPPSSPASFTHSALPSTAQSPNNNYLSLSANSPGGPSSSIYATGPYAHERQLVSPPPVFSTLTTQPSTAPFTPPPELTTPSSPDVPYARFLTSSKNYNDLRSPQTRVSTPLQESNFFCPETFAKFYLDHDPSVPLNGGRLSVSKDSDVYPTNGNQNRQTRQDMEELEEAYRASFGFSADDIITTSQYVEITDVMDESLLKATKVYSPSDGQMLLRREADLLSQTNSKTEEAVDFHSPKGYNGESYNSFITISCFHCANSVIYCVALLDHRPRKGIHADEEALLSRVGSVKKGSRSYPTGVSSSDAEVEYRRGRSLRESRESRHRR